MILIYKYLRHAIWWLLIIFVRLNNYSHGATIIDDKMITILQQCIVLGVVNWFETFCFQKCLFFCKTNDYKNIKQKIYGEYSAEIFQFLEWIYSSHS